MNGDFKPIENFIDDLSAEEQAFAILYLMDKMKQYIPIERLSEIFETVKNGVHVYRSVRRTLPPRKSSQRTVLKKLPRCSINRL